MFGGVKIVLPHMQRSTNSSGYYLQMNSEDLNLNASSSLWPTIAICKNVLVMHLLGKDAWKNIQIGKR